MQSKTISVKKASPDMVLFEDVYSFSGQLIIPKGTRLDTHLITKLKFYSITEITIVIEDLEIEKIDIEVQEIVQDKESPLRQYAEKNKEKELSHQNVDPEYIKIIRSTKEYISFNKNVLESAKVLENSLSSFVTKAGVDLDSNKLLNLAKEVIIMNKNPMNTFHMLQNIRKYDDATFIHSLNVAIICNIFGRWINMSQEDLDILTLAGLLHDIGKMQIPEEIIKKPAFLTDVEYSVIKLHPKRGYNILESMRIDDRIKKSVLMHHERCDGSGYPYGIKGNQIDDFAKIVAIADIYDAMTSARVYRGPLCPFEVISVFETDGYQKFEPKFVIPFLEGIVNSYLNEKVILSDGRIGIIALNNKNSLSRPIVRVDDTLIDLSKEPDLSISCVM